MIMTNGIQCIVFSACDVCVCNSVDLSGKSRYSPVSREALRAIFARAILFRDNAIYNFISPL